MRNRIKAIISIGLALCAFGAQSQTILSPVGSDLAAGGMFDSAATLPADSTATQNAGADTLHITPEMIRNMNIRKPLEEFETELESVVFVPKGQWVTGINISYSQSNQNNYQFVVFEGISGDTYSFKVSPMLCYMFANDMGAGLRFSYNRALTKLEKADIVIDSETSYTADHLYSLSHNYAATMFFRNYFSIGHSKRFGFFVDAQCLLGGGQSKFTTGVSEDLSGAYERNFHLNVGIVPGLSLFLNNFSAMEVTVGVLGFDYTDTKTLTDRIYVARRKSKMANFNINLFSITFGVSFYI